ncbi:MAG: hypothetical protein JKY04_07045, partial [Sneathiella sp.]|nr:hypothetical protein [Sneathiella sp.]
MTATHEATSPTPKPPKAYIVQAKQRATIFQYLINFLAKFLSVISPKLAAKWLFLLFTTPQEYRESEQEKSYMRDATIWRIPFNSRQSMPLYSWGHGPTILLVHGLSGRASQMG